ncbi:MAG TPA: YggS family pyridoxal phosphate-dependent enzyme [Clostridiales bacterium]|nr:YggS family pyridoxal phosphate-dependent enzyme [Clostridiales bacterium]
MIHIMTPEQRKFIRSNIQRIRFELNEAVKNTPAQSREVILLAATKTRTPEEINCAIDCGITHIGENRVQELLAKYDGINKSDVKIHFIGHLQTNKVKYIVDKVDMIQSVDRLSLANEISQRALEKGKQMDILVELNLGYEENKSGIEPEKTEAFIRSISHLKGISIKGLMAIPPICTDSVRQMEFFQKIFGIFIDILRKNIDNSNMQVLSIGMSDDYGIAAQAGSTMVRIGSGIFGTRQYPPSSAAK